MPLFLSDSEICPLNSRPCLVKSIRICRTISPRYIPLVIFSYLLCYKRRKNAFKWVASQLYFTSGTYTPLRGKSGPKASRTEQEARRNKARPTFCWEILRTALFDKCPKVEIVLQEEKQYTSLLFFFVRISALLTMQQMKSSIKNSFPITLIKNILQLSVSLRLASSGSQDQNRPVYLCFPAFSEPSSTCISYLVLMLSMQPLSPNPPHSVLMHIFPSLPSTISMFFMSSMQHTLLPVPRRKEMTWLQPEE